MLEIFKKNPRFLVGAIVVHLFFIVLFGIGFHFKSKQRASTASQKTVEVKMIDERQLKKELAKLKKQDDREAKRKKELADKRKAEEKKLKKKQEQRLAEQKKEKQRIALLKKKEKEKKRKKKKEREQKIKEERLERERKAKEEELDRVRKEKELKEKMLAEATLMKKEQEAVALRQAELKKRQTIIDKYMNLIELKVYQHWIKPPAVSKGLVSELRVKLIPTGEVIDVQLSKSSGDAVYDKSVQTAVKRASPLPLPPAEEGLFDTFRDLRLPMRADKKT